MSTTNVSDPNQTASAPSNPAQPTPWDGCGAKPAPGAVPADGVPAEVAVTAETPTENKEQLHRRVESRLAELAVAQAQLAGQDGNQDRAQALETEFQVARDAMSGGWEHVGQMEAAQLSQWLTNTETLILARPVQTSPPQG